MKRARFTERRIGERNVMPMRPPIPPPPIPSPAPRPPPSPPPACAHARPPPAAFPRLGAFGGRRAATRSRMQAALSLSTCTATTDLKGATTARPRRSPARRGRARAVARAAEAGRRIIEIGRERILAPASAAIASPTAVSGGDRVIRRDNGPLQGSCATRSGELAALVGWTQN
jgi:hypothetical protein